MRRRPAVPGVPGTGEPQEDSTHNRFNAQMFAEFVKKMAAHLRQLHDLGVDKCSMNTRAAASSSARSCAISSSASEGPELSLNVTFRHQS